MNSPQISNTASSWWKWPYIRPPPELPSTQEIEAYKTWPKESYVCDWIPGVLSWLLTDIRQSLKHTFATFQINQGHLPNWGGGGAKNKSKHPWPLPLRLSADGLTAPDITVAGPLARHETFASVGAFLPITFRALTYCLVFRPSLPKPATESCLLWRGLDSTQDAGTCSSSTAAWLHHCLAKAGHQHFPHPLKTGWATMSATLDCALLWGGGREVVTRIYETFCVSSKLPVNDMILLC